MIRILLLACAFGPFYPATFDGPPCSPERQALECECSEALAWDAATGADRYEVWRRTVSTGSLCRAGILRRSLTSEPGEPDAWAWPPLVWSPALDGEREGICTFPRAGTLYEYAVRACSGALCSEDSGAVQYRGTDYECVVAGEPRQCHVGDPCVGCGR